MTTPREAKYLEMTTTAPGKLVAKMALPSIVTMLISNVYNMADTFFVGRIDTQSTAALGIVFSYMAMVQAIAFFFGQGSGNYISRALGRKEGERAEIMATVGLLSAMLLGSVVAAIGLLFTQPILRFFGSTETILPYAEAYFRWILPGTPFIIGCFALNNQMRQQGNALMSMIGIASGAILNILIDPLFIFTLGMGVEGAGVATCLSQAVSFFILLHMAGKRGGVGIRLSRFKPTAVLFREIAAGGSPSLVRQGLGAVVAICLNQVAAQYGDATVAAISIVNRFVLFVGAAMIGYGQGFQPVCGFNYGARLYNRVRTAFWSCVRISTVYCTLIALLGILFAPDIIRLFRADDAEVIRIGSILLRWQCLAYPFIGFVIMTNMYLQNIRRTRLAILVASARQGLFLIPTLYIGVMLCGFRGLETAQCISDFLAFILSVPICLKVLREMK